MVDRDRRRGAHVRRLRHPPAARRRRRRPRRRDRQVAREARIHRAPATRAVGQSPLRPPPTPHSASAGRPGRSRCAAAPRCGTATRRRSTSGRMSSTCARFAPGRWPATTVRAWQPTARSSWSAPAAPTVSPRSTTGAARSTISASGSELLERPHMHTSILFVPREAPVPGDRRRGRRAASAHDGERRRGDLAMSIQPPLTWAPADVAGHAPGPVVAERGAASEPAVTAPTRRRFVGPDVVPRRVALIGVVVMNYHGYFILDGGRNDHSTLWGRFFDPWRGPLSTRFAATFRARRRRRRHLADEQRAPPTTATARPSQPSAGRWCGAASRSTRSA